MSSPLDVKNKKKQELYIPKTLELANSLFQSFIKKNNVVGLKLCLILSGASNTISYNNDNQVTLDIDTICKIMNVSRSELAINIKKVLEIHFTFVDSDGGVGATIPIHSYFYKSNNKQLIIEVSSMAKKLFTELGKGGYSFSRANALNLMNLKHKHSLRMQLLLEQIHSFNNNVAKRKRYSLEELNGYFGVNYSRFIDIDRKILKPVKEEIDKSSNLCFIYEFIDEHNGNGRPKIKEVLIDIIEKK